MIEAGYAIWDVLEGCCRKGSADKAIKNATPNDIRSFLQTYPTVTRIVFNSRSTAQFFLKYFGSFLNLFYCGNQFALDVFGKKVAHEASDKQKIQLLVMESTSPAHATIRYEEKERQWRAECYEAEGFKIIKS